jgi:hypothetical protein
MPVIHLNIAKLYHGISDARDFGNDMLSMNKKIMYENIIQFLTANATRCKDVQEWYAQYVSTLSHFVQYTDCLPCRQVYLDGGAHVQNGDEGNDDMAELLREAEEEAEQVYALALPKLTLLTPIWQTSVGSFSHNGRGDANLGPCQAPIPQHNSSPDEDLEGKPSSSEATLATC